MDTGAWSSKHQVQDTLRKLSNGKRQLGNLDNTYFVQGNKPPPVISEDTGMFTILKPTF